MVRFLLGLGVATMLIVGLFILGTCAVFVLAPSETKTGPAITETTTSTTTPAPVPVITWKKVISWEGKSSKNTETFHISSDEWRIRWSTKTGEYGDMNFIVLVYKANDTLLDVAINTIGENSDVSYMRGSGNYYLSIDTLQPYTIIVEEKIVEEKK